mmetsp:Transcript_970/g.1828  ORF Transcript_970/g.1828 Transcript_970/m.1828 type:complete len:181 (-) Transcript_970:974-1516(-)
MFLDKARSWSMNPEDNEGFKIFCLPHKVNGKPCYCSNQYWCTILGEESALRLKQYEMHGRSPGITGTTSQTQKGSGTNSEALDSGSQPNSKIACSICGGRFQQPSSLNRHIRAVHKKERPFECNQCGRMFSERSNLRKHVDAIHEKLRPFVCDFCDYAFFERNKLVAHLSSVHHHYLGPS